jgi:hypothetical protein
MKFNLIDEVPFPRDVVFPVLRDKLHDLTAYLPNVDRIVTESREVDGDVVNLFNVWYGASDEIPGILRPFIKTDFLKWTDKARWDQGNWCVDWEIDLSIIPGAISAKGHNEYDDEGDETVIRMQGEFVVHPERIPAIPTAIGRASASTLERWVIGLVEPNLRKTNQVVADYLEDHWEG